MIYRLLWVYLAVLVSFASSQCYEKLPTEEDVVKFDQQGFMPAQGALPPLKYQGKASGTFSFASYYGSHMVLQQAPKKAAIWGYAPTAAKGQTVTLTVTSSAYNKVYHTQVMDGPIPNTGIWWLQLDPLEDGPYTLKGTLGSYTPITLDDVLFGDVWLCSGQSNMQFTVSQMFNASEEIANAHLYPKIRVFTVADVTSTVPLYDLKTVQEPWSLPSSSSIGHGDWSYFSATCWVYGKLIFEKLQRPLGLIATDWGGTPIEAWSSPESLRRCGLKQGMEDAPPPSTHSVLWNAMVHPFLPMTIYGAIWYQGESNANAPNTYNCTFPGMIDDWRKQFHGMSGGQTDPSFPFGFVQLATDDPAPNATGGFPDIRWHQTADVGYVPNHRMNNVFMAVAMDLRDDKSPYGSIHPRDKTTVGERLSAAGLAIAYDDWQQEFQGPFPNMIVVDKAADTVTVQFDMDIVVRAKDGYELCCTTDASKSCDMSAFDNWYAVTISASSKNSVTLTSQPCSSLHVVGIRYEWRMTPCLYKQCAVYSASGVLPSPPYINMHIAG